MRRLLVFALAGLIGQLVDGALGMAFGVTTSTVLLSNGFSRAVASASVHLAEVGTTFTSGLSHWRFGNVNWRLVARIGVPGAIGAFVGATVLSSITGDWLKPMVAVILFGLGTLVIVRSVRGDLRGEHHDPGHLRTRFLAPLGLSAGFLDAVGGGGWGPVATPTLLRSEEHTSELQSLRHLVCRILLEKKKQSADFADAIKDFHAGVQLRDGQHLRPDNLPQDTPCCPWLMRW